MIKPILYQTRGKQHMLIEQSEDLKTLTLSIITLDDPHLMAPPFQDGIHYQADFKEEPGTRAVIASLTIEPEGMSTTTAWFGGVDDFVEFIVPNLLNEPDHRFPVDWEVMRYMKMAALTALAFRFGRNAVPFHEDDIRMYLYEEYHMHVSEFLEDFEIGVENGLVRDPFLGL